MYKISVFKLQFISSTMFNDFGHVVTFSKNLNYVSGAYPEYDVITDYKIFSKHF